MRAEWKANQRKNMKRTEARGEEAWRTGEAHLTDAVKLSWFIVFGYLMWVPNLKLKQLKIILLLATFKNKSVQTKGRPSLVQWSSTRLHQQEVGIQSYIDPFLNAPSSRGEGGFSWAFKYKIAVSFSSSIVHVWVDLPCMWFSWTFPHCQ